MALARRDVEIGARHTSRQAEDRRRAVGARAERKGVRIFHSIDDGEYGGETIVRSDEEKKSVVYHHSTTAGFATTGTMTFENGKITTNEKVPETPAAYRRSAA